MKRRRAEDQFDIVLESLYESSDEDEADEGQDEAIDEDEEDKDQDDAIDDDEEDKDQDEAIDEDEEDKDQDEAIDEDEEGEDHRSSRGGGVDLRKEYKKACAAGFCYSDGEEEDEEDCEDGDNYVSFERLLQENDFKNHTEYDDNDDDDDDATEADRQAFLQSVPEHKLFTLKCVTGHEREVVVCLMQKCIERGSEFQIRSAFFFEDVKNCIYIEADEKAHVIEACKGVRNIYIGNQDLLGPMKENTDVLSVESKPIDLSRDTFVRMKIGTHKGDLAKVVDVDNPGSPRSRACEAPSPGGTYSEAGTPRDSTPADANAPGPYLPSTPGGQPPPITPGLFLPGILVTVRRSGDDAVVGVIQEVLLDGAYWVAVGGEMITANPHEMEVVVRRKLDK